MTRGGGEDTPVIANPTVGPDGCRGWAIYVGLGGTSQKEALSNCRREGSQEGVSEGWCHQENPKVCTRDGCTS